jgi:hypothetical protein
MMLSTGANLTRLPERCGSHQYSGGPVRRDISGANRRMGEGNKNLVCLSPWDFKRSLTCRKILRHGTSGFTSHPKKGVLRIFIDLNNASPWPGSNPRPLGQVASTLTTTPPRRLLALLLYILSTRVGEIRAYAMMEAVRTSETSVNFNVTTRRYIPEHSELLSLICCN